MQTHKTFQELDIYENLHKNGSSNQKNLMTPKKYKSQNKNHSLDSHYKAGSSSKNDPDSLFWDKSYELKNNVG